MVMPLHCDFDKGVPNHETPDNMNCYIFNSLFFNDFKA